MPAVMILLNYFNKRYMKRYFKLITIILCTSILASCQFFNRKGASLLPNVSGKAGEILVVLDKNSWENSMGVDIRATLASNCTYLAQKEALYSLINISPRAFSDMFNIHRNILLFNIGNDIINNNIVYQNNIWSKPQCVIQINAQSHEIADSLFKENKERIIATFEQAERNRVIENSKLYEQREISKLISDLIDYDVHIPIGYRLMKKTSDFIWIQDEKQYSIQGIFAYKYPVENNKDNFSMTNIISKRNDFLEKNVPGTRPDSWMTTSFYIEPNTSYLKYQGKEFAQTRGFWDLHNDYMGGPFVSHSFYSPDGKYIVVLEAFIYAPKLSKRQLLRQTESILYSVEDKKTENK